MGNFFRNKRIFTSSIPPLDLDIESSGSGVSLVTNDDKIKSLVAGTNIVITDNGDSVTIDTTAQDEILIVNNYSSLPDPTTVSGQFYWVSNSEGTSWLPGSLGGTYYNKGLYYSNGVSWEYIETPYQATQAEVNTGTNNDKFVTPSTLSNSNWAFTTAKVLATLLTGLSVATGGTIVSTDSVLIAFGKLQNQINTLNTLLDNYVLKVSSTDKAIVRFNGITGEVQNSNIILNDEGSITFPGVAAPSYTQGKLAYDTSNECLTFFNNNSNVGLQIGQEAWIRVRNDSGSSIANGSAVYISGTHASGIPQISLAQANAAATTIVAGLATETIPNNTIGYVTSIGLVRGLNTSGFAAGATVFLSATTPGALTTTVPTSPNYRFRVGIVTRSNISTGTIHVTPSTGAVGNGTAGQVLGINGSGNQAFLNASEIVGYQGYTTQSYLANTLASPADGTTYYFGGAIAGLATAADARRLYFPKAGTIKGALVLFINGSPGSAETSSIFVRLNNTTDTLISNTVVNNATNTRVINSSLSIPINATSDYVEIKWTTPTWVTNPTSVLCLVILYIE